MAGFRPMSHAELMAPIGMEQDGIVLREVVEPVVRGPRHQARLARGTRVRVRGLVQDGPQPRYLVETCDERAVPAGRWSLVAAEDIGEAPRLNLLRWLRSRLW
jgi:hypothetical protein